MNEVLATIAQTAAARRTGRRSGDPALFRAAERVVRSVEAARARDLAAVAERVERLGRRLARLTER